MPTADLRKITLSTAAKKVLGFDAARTVVVIANVSSTTRAFYNFNGSSKTTESFPVDAGETASHVLALGFETRLGYYMFSESGTVDVHIQAHSNRALADAILRKAAIPTAV